MGTFTAQWLAEREPVDSAARSAVLAARASALMPVDQVVRVVDLASGTGSNLRYLAERLPLRQSWLLVDQDAELLALAPRRIAEWAGAGGYRVSDQRGEMLMSGDRLTCRVAVRRAELSASVREVLVDGLSLVTASALLDLVSDDWIGSVASRCRQIRSAALFALTYDGRVRCSPEDTEDSRIIHLVNEHQQTNKGFGRALGTGAVRATERHFLALGFDVLLAESDWELAPLHAGLQQSLILGWAEAAREMAPSHSRTIRDWCARRLAHVAAGSSRIRVGHQDVLAWPGAVR